MEIVVFEMEHLDFILPNLREFELLGGTDFRSTVEVLQSISCIVTFMHEGVPAAIFGATQRWEGVAEVWSLTTDQVDRAPVAFFKACLRGLDHIEKILKPQRVEAAVHERHARSCRWLEHLGFENEGLMRKYRQGTNYHRYARVW